MASLSGLQTHTGFSGDAIDRALALAWIASEIAVDVFGMVFWSALALLVARLFG